MTSGLRYIGQALIYGLVAVALGVFSIWPSYTSFPADQALIKSSDGASRVQISSSW